MKQNDNQPKVTITLERDEWMKEEWKTVKMILEGGFEYVYGIKVALTEPEVFAGLLFCFEDEVGYHHFPKSFNDEELEAIKQRRSKVKR